MRIGWRMQEVADYVARHPGCVMYEAARYVAPRGPHNAGEPGVGYGYRTVWRAVHAGLVKAQPDPRRQGSYRLYPANTK